MEALFADVNWLAVGVGTIISFILSGLWYSPKMFGTKWAKGVGVNVDADAKQPMPALVTQFIGTLLFAWVVALAYTNGSIASIVLISITFFFLLVAANLFAEHSVYATVVEGMLIITMGLIMVVCNIFL